MGVVVLAEDDSDVETLTPIIRGIAGQPGLPVKGKGYHGGPHLFRKAARDIRAFHSRGFGRFVICHDADGPDHLPIARRIEAEILAKAEVQAEHCVAVPVQEIEAWLIADPDAINSVLPTFSFAGDANPEAIASPKEWLVRQSRNPRKKPLYVPRVFNPRVAERLSIDAVAARCPSFARFRESVAAWFA